MLFKRIARKYKSKPMVKKTNIDKRITAVAKRVMNTQTETKSAYYVLSGSSLLDSSLYCSNICAGITEGVLNQNVIGQKLTLKDIHYRVWLRTIGDAVPRSARICVVASNQRMNTLTNFSFLTPTQSLTFFRSTSSAVYNSINQLDLHKCDVLYDNHVIFNPSLSALDAQERVLDIRIPINKNVTFDQDNGSYFKNKTYYLLVQTMEAATVGYPINWQATVAVNFKDA